MFELRALISRSCFSVLTVILFGVLALGFQAQAADPNVLFQRLKQSGVSYQVEGTICEQAARLQLEASYPAPRYQVINDLTYSEGGQTIGELDDVVIDNQTNRAVLVAEVKCWQDFASALRKADKQRQRFLTNMKHPQGIIVHSRQLDRDFDVNLISGVKKFITISQAGGESAGFDMCLPYGLEQLMDVRERLIRCQQQGTCR